MSKKKAGVEGASRREFLKRTGAAAVAAGLVTPGILDAAATRDIVGEARESIVLPKNPATATAMATRNLGKTGYKVGIFSLGGQAAIEQPKNEEVAVAIVERAIDLGVNYIDKAAQYGGDERWSQRYIGQVMKGRRN
jgi:hypothetical protein